MALENSAENLELDGLNLTVEQVEHVSKDSSVTVSLAKEVYPKLRASRELVDRWVESGKTIYGITTGFGEFANVAIERADIEQLQVNLIRSHSVGAGRPLPNDIVRGMLLLRINALARGNSGISIESIETLISMLNNNLTPIVPSQGSVGSSGDLVPLAHMVLAAMGEGEVFNEASEVEASNEALTRLRIEPLRLRAKEGLALINGTQYMTSFGSIVTSRAKRLMRLADVISSLSLEALKGSDRPFDERLHSLRPHVGQGIVAANLRRLIQGSQIRESHREDDDRVQDAYSLRCIPQIHGASRDALDYTERILEIEINSATDNPLIFPDDEEIVEGGNFHGQPVALALDFLGIALSEIANVSERRIERLVNGTLSRLPRFLTPLGGLNSGYMIAQYTAASVVSENKILAHPASVDSIPTSANQEDHNSMGSIAARKLLQISDNVQTVLAIELLCACQGMDFHRPLKSSPALERAHVALRSRVPFLDKDRVLQVDLAAARELLDDSFLLDQAIGSNECRID